MANTTIRKYRKFADIYVINVARMCSWICCVDVLDMYEAWHSSSYRQKAIDEIYEHICADDAVSHGISIGPVRVHLLSFFLKSCFFQFFV